METMAFAFYHCGRVPPQSGRQLQLGDARWTRAGYLSLLSVPASTREYSNTQILQHDVETYRPHRGCYREVQGEGRILIRRTPMAADCVPGIPYQDR